MEQDITTNHGMAPIIIRDPLPMAMEYIIVLMVVGVSRLELVLAGVFIHTEGVIGERGDIIEDTGMDITVGTIVDTVMDIAEEQKLDMQPAHEIQTAMYITTVVQESNKPVTQEMPRHQII